ncbi:MAG TPA: ABC transporter permease [Chloroflexia bacterium]|nr:ABC transporter permease [Chloroflexia bacterium]
MFKRLIRVSGFVSKEVREIVRQPRLLLSLLLGPFLILLLFGAGYLGVPAKLRGIVAIPNDPSFLAQKDVLRERFSKGIDVLDVTSDLEGAKARLRAGGIDVVIAVPADAAEKIGAGAQAIVPVYYNEVDPIGESRIQLGTLAYTNDLNKETIAAAFKQGQSGAGNIKDALTRIDTTLANISQDLATGQVPTAQGRISEVRSSADAVALSAGLFLQLMEAAPPEGSTDANSPQRQNLSRTETSLQNLNADVAALQTDLASPAPDATVVSQRTEKVRADVRELQGLTVQFQQMNAYVFAAPFYGQAENLAGKPTFINFYTPGVLALLLQHIAVTLGALSMVRERMLGSVELFRVSPITPGEILTGKYLGFTIFLAVLASALIALVIFGLGVPMQGDYGWLAVSLLLLIFASLGLGFGLSMLSGTESQAVQLAMLTLLTSVFFGGFFLPLASFIAPVQGVSYALPVTHGIISLQDIMLRGRDPNWFYPGMLLGLGVLFAAFSMWRFSREFRRG